jgi:hypothetical protein
MFCQLPIEIVADDSGLNAGVAILNAYFKNPVHSGEVDDDSAVDRNGASAQAGSRAPGDDGNFMIICKCHNPGHLFCGFG